MPTHILMLAMALAKSDAGKAGPGEAYFAYHDELTAFVQANGGDARMLNAMAAAHMLMGVASTAPPNEVALRLDTTMESAGTIARTMAANLPQLMADDKPTLH